MLNRIPLILGALGALAIALYSSVFVISPREQALVLRFGQITRVVTEPGLYFKLPTAVVDTVQLVSKQVRRFDLDDIRVQVRDGRRYIVDAFVAYKIVDLVIGLRVSEEEEREGLDISSHGESAYRM